MTPEKAAPVSIPAESELVYISDADPGISRQRHGEHFRYLGADGKPLRDAAALERIKSLVIPPAWEQVWISPTAASHIQATGRDARGRKQYLYHPVWRQNQEAYKYEKLALFGEALPRIRHVTKRHLALRGLPREKVLATIVRLLDVTAIRVGNARYAQQNKSFGLTTLRNRHVKVKGREKMEFYFLGKSGKRHRISVQDRSLVAIVKKCQELPGQNLFSYLNGDKVPRQVGSSDVNAYIQEITGQPFTAKDFRTWGATSLAAGALAKRGPAPNKTAAKRAINEVVKEVAERLGNTPTICRKSYLHPQLLEAYASLIYPSEKLLEKLERRRGLRKEESTLLAFLYSL